MIGLILAAGPTCCCDSIGFPPNSKPKCLFHHGKYDSSSTLLERQVRLLRKNGIKRIRIVTGYRRKDIEQFNRDKSLDLELIYNPKWETDGVNSLIVGIQGIEDDLLIVMGDLFIGEKDLENIIRCEKPTVALTMGHQSLYKFDKQHLSLLKRADELRRSSLGIESNLRELHSKGNVKCPCDLTQGIKLASTLSNIWAIIRKNGEAVDLPKTHDVDYTFDIDYFKQTNEKKRAHLFK